VAHWLLRQGDEPVVHLHDLDDRARLAQCLGLGLHRRTPQDQRGHVPGDFVRGEELSSACIGHLQVRIDRPQHIAESLLLHRLRQQRQQNRELLEFRSRIAPSNRVIARFALLALWPVNHVAECHAGQLDKVREHPIRTPPSRQTLKALQ